jgi:hypothetical protein
MWHVIDRLPLHCSVARAPPCTGCYSKAVPGNDCYTAAQQGHIAQNFMNSIKHFKYFNHLCVPWPCLQELLGPASHRLPYAVRHAPSLLGWSPDTLSSRLDGLQQILNCSRDRVCAMLGACPAIVEADLETTGSKLQQLTAGKCLPCLHDSDE